MLIPCPDCHGDQVLRDGCPLCSGAGVIEVLPEQPSSGPGYLAVKACGCAAAWVSFGAPHEYLTAQLDNWRARGWRILEQPDGEECKRRVAEGSRCTHPGGTVHDPVTVRPKGAE